MSLLMLEIKETFISSMLLRTFKCYYYLALLMATACGLSGWSILRWTLTIFP